MATVIRGQDNFNSNSAGIGTTVDAVNSYGFFGDYNGYGIKLPGATLSGSLIDYEYDAYSFSYNALSQSLSGTWRVMGYTGGSYYNNGTCLVRIS